MCFKFKRGFNIFSTMFFRLFQGALSLESRGVQCCAGNYNHRTCTKEFWKNRSGFENDDKMNANQFPEDFQEKPLILN